MSGVLHCRPFRGSGCTSAAQSSIVAAVGVGCSEQRTVARFPLLTSSDSSLSSIDLFLARDRVSAAGAFKQLAGSTSESK
jgi:hypothetical protein